MACRIRRRESVSINVLCIFYNVAALYDYLVLPHSMHCRADGRVDTQIRPRRKMHDFGDLRRALEMVAMVALLLGMALSG